MKQKHNYIETSIWYKEKIDDPYQVIAKFFFSVDLIGIRKTIKAMLLAALSDKVYKKSSPGDLLLDFKLIESVINAAYLINKENKTSPIDIANPDLLDANLYRGPFSGTTDWEYLPRVLSLKEYKNPYLVFKRFFKFQDLHSWKHILQEIADNALSRATLSEADHDVDCLSLYFYLTKLVEAAHLIDVREITHIDGMIKDKFKNAA